MAIWKGVKPEACILQPASWIWHSMKGLFVKPEATEVGRKHCANEHHQLRDLTKLVPEDEQIRERLNWSARTRQGEEEQMKLKEPTVDMSGKVMPEDWGHSRGNKCWGSSGKCLGFSSWNFLLCYIQNSALERLEFRLPPAVDGCGANPLREWVTAERVWGSLKYSKEQEWQKYAGWWVTGGMSHWTMRAVIREFILCVVVLEVASHRWEGRAPSGHCMVL